MYANERDTIQRAGRTGLRSLSFLIRSGLVSPCFKFDFKMTGRRGGAEPIHDSVQDDVKP